jgi:hypothetical protein
LSWHAEDKFSINAATIARRTICECRQDEENAEEDPTAVAVMLCDVFSIVVKRKWMKNSG